MLLPRLTRGMDTTATATTGPTTDTAATTAMVTTDVATATTGDKKLLPALTLLRHDQFFQSPSPG